MGFKKLQICTDLCKLTEVQLYNFLQTFCIYYSKMSAVHFFCGRNKIVDSGFQRTLESKGLKLWFKQSVVRKFRGINDKGHIQFD